MARHKSIRWEKKPTICDKCHGMGTIEDSKGRESRCRYCIDGYNYNKLISYDLDKRQKDLEVFLGE